MAIGRITYEDKIDSSVNEQDPKYKITAQDMNEIKQVFNESAEDIEFATENLGDYKVENGVIYFKKADGSYNEQGVSLAGQSTILDGDGNVILSGNITPNDNLLTNSDYRYSVINQKGKLSYSASNQMTYTIDMWRIYNGTLSVVNGIDYNGWKYSNNTSTEYALEQLVNLQYDTYTLMVDLTDISGNCRIKLWGENDNLINEKAAVDGINILNGTGVIKKVQLCLANGSFVFKKAKLEEGQYYTGMPPWNGTVELIKCMRYFQLFDRAPMYTTTLYNPTYFMVAGFFVPMHKKPSMKVTKILNSNKETQAQSLVSYIVSNYGLVDFTISANIGQYGYVSCEFDAYDYE